MKRMLSGIVGIGLIFQTSTTECASRKFWGIPKPGKESCISEGYFPPGIYYKKYDIDRDGLPDMVEYYLEGKKNPFMLWYDRNRNAKPDKGEVYISPEMNEDWRDGKEVDI
ncbi:MAG: hypothetical protein QXN71_04045 [Candidatus Aenigmatarchaeota archaeon]